MSIPCIRGHHFDSSLLHSDSVIIDLGGHKGEFSSEVHEKFDCTAFIIEAMPDLYASIIQKHKLHTFHYAISDSIGSIQFHVSENPESNSIFSQSTTNAGTILVPSITLEAFMNQQGIESVDLLKMDIEGAEIAVFDSLSDSMLSRFKQITVEFHDFIPELAIEDDVLRIINRLTSLHFHCIVFSRHTHFDVLFINALHTNVFRILYIRCIKYIHGIQRIIKRLFGIDSH